MGAEFKIYFCLPSLPPTRINDRGRMGNKIQCLLLMLLKVPGQWRDEAGSADDVEL